MSTYTKPLPKIDDLTRPYWELARLHQLSVQRCLACGHCHFPPSPVCPACLSEDQGWEVVSGRAELNGSPVRVTQTLRVPLSGLRKVMKRPSGEIFSWEICALPKKTASPS